MLSDIPGLGEIFFSQNLLVYLAYLLVPIAWFVLNKTTLGLKIRSVGENPEAADSLGVSVAGIRYFTIVLGGTLSGVAGASLSIALLNVFQQNMTSGMGFIAVALVYFGGWRPWGVLVGALLFSYGELTAIVDPGVGHPHSIGNRCDDALCTDHPGAGCFCIQGAQPICVNQTV